MTMALISAPAARAAATAAATAAAATVPRAIRRGITTATASSKRISSITATITATTTSSTSTVRGIMAGSGSSRTSGMRAASSSSGPAAAASAPAAAAGRTYGAPYTTSIKFAPIAMTATAAARGTDTAAAATAARTSAAGGLADQYMITVAAPGLNRAEVTIFSRDNLAFVANKVQEGTGAHTVRVIVNGAPVPEAQLADVSVGQLFGNCVEFELDGLRFSVNEGLRLSALGAAARRSLVKSYAFMATGAAATVVFCFWFWRKVIPRDNQRV